MPPRPKATKESTIKINALESTKPLTEYYSMSKRGSINNIIARIKATSVEK